MSRGLRCEAQAVKRPTLDTDPSRHFGGWLSGGRQRVREKMRQETGRSCGGIFIHPLGLQGGVTRIHFGRQEMGFWDSKTSERIALISGPAHLCGQGAGTGCVGMSLAATDAPRCRDRLKRRRPARSGAHNSAFGIKLTQGHRYIWTANTKNLEQCIGALGRGLQIYHLQAFDRPLTSMPFSKRNGAGAG